MIDINTILSWFKTGLKPTQAQFWASWQSFWHKDEQIPQSSIENLSIALNAKAEKSQLDGHITDPNAHADLLISKVDKVVGERLINAVEIAKLSELANATTTIKSILSTALITQNVAGFVTYINALNPLLNVGLNETVKFKTDTGRIFELLLNDRSFGVGEPPIVADDVFEITEFLNKDIQLSNYPSTRNDGQLPTNKVLSTDVNGNLKMYTIATAPAPYLDELIPDSYLPSTTGNIVLKGAFFTPAMTVTIIGQRVNYVTFISDNEVHVNMTTGEAEGSFNLILNNGLSTIFYNRILVILGEAYVPKESDYIGLTSDVDGTEPGSLFTLNHLKDLAVSIELDRNNPKLSIPHNQNFVIRFNIEPPQENGTKSIDYYPYTVIGLYKKIDDSQLIAIVPHATSYDEFKIYFEGSELLWTSAGNGGIIDNSLSSYKYRWGHTYEIRRVGTVIEYRIDNVVRHTINTNITDDLYVKIAMMPYHIVNIKVIKLIL